MSRSADSPQAVWQVEFSKHYPDCGLANWWWHNPTNYNSLRLTYEAYANVKSQVKFHKFTLSHDIRPKCFVQLERYFKEPYYVQNRKTIHIVSERDAMMLALHANNLQQYLDNLDS